MIGAALQLAMIFGPPAAYIDQYTTMRRTGSSRGFSTAICGLLLVGNLLRIFFWFGRRFDDTLLWQSLLMIGAQIVLLHLCIRCRALDEPNGSWMHERSIWRWPQFSDYMSFLAQIAVALGVLQLLLGPKEWYIDIIGYLAVGTEAMLPVPQVLTNYRRKSVEGFSPVVLLSWLGGDLFKTGYYYMTEAPLQFLLCGLFQLTMDFVIIGQTIAYGLGIKSRQLADSGSHKTNFMSSHSAPYKKFESDQV